MLIRDNAGDLLKEKGEVEVIEDPQEFKDLILQKLEHEVSMLIIHHKVGDNIENNLAEVAELVEWLGIAYDYRSLQFHRDDLKESHGLYWKRYKLKT